MRKGLVALVTGVSLLAPASANAFDLELVKREQHAHDFGGGGFFYGNGIEKSEYNIKLSEFDISRSDGNNYHLLTSVAQKIYEVQYKDECGCMSVEDVIIDLFIQNSKLLVEKAEVGDVLTYRMARTYGHGLTSIM